MSVSQALDGRFADHNVYFAAVRFLLTNTEQKRMPFPRLLKHMNFIGRMDCYLQPANLATHPTSRLLGAAARSLRFRRKSCKKRMPEGRPRERLSHFFFFLLTKDDFQGFSGNTDAHIRGTPFPSQGHPRFSFARGPSPSAASTSLRRGCCPWGVTLSTNFPGRHSLDRGFSRSLTRLWVKKHHRGTTRVNPCFHLPGFPFWVHIFDPLPPGSLCSIT